MKERKKEWGKDSQKQHCNLLGEQEGAQESNMLIENMQDDRPSATEREKGEQDERWTRGKAANSVAREAGVEEGIWTELWSRSLPVRLTQQQPCHWPNPPNHPFTRGAETSKDWRRGFCRESNNWWGRRVRERKHRTWEERMDGLTDKEDWNKMKEG